MEMTKEKAAAKAKHILTELQGEYKQSGSLPTDKRITQLAYALHERDRHRDTPNDFEMNAVTRGIIHGMMLMRQIIEG